MVYDMESNVERARTIMGSGEYKLSYSEFLEQKRKCQNSIAGEFRNWFSVIVCVRQLMSVNVNKI